MSTSKKFLNHDENNMHETQDNTYNTPQNELFTRTIVATRTTPPVPELETDKAVVPELVSVINTCSPLVLASSKDENTTNVSSKKDKVFSAKNFGGLELVDSLQLSLANFSVTVSEGVNGTRDDFIFPHLDVEGIKKANTKDKATGSRAPPVRKTLVDRNWWTTSGVRWQTPQKRSARELMGRVMTSYSPIRIRPRAVGAPPVRKTLVDRNWWTTSGVRRQTPQKRSARESR